MRNNNYFILSITHFIFALNNVKTHFKFFIDFILCVEDIVIYHSNKDIHSLGIKMQQTIKNLQDWSTLLVPRFCIVKAQLFISPQNGLKKQPNSLRYPTKHLL